MYIKRQIMEKMTETVYPPKNDNSIDLLIK